MEVLIYIVSYLMRCRRHTAGRKVKIPASHISDAASKLYCNWSHIRMPPGSFVCFSFDVNLIDYGAAAETEQKANEQKSHCSTTEDGGDSKVRSSVIFTYFFNLIFLVLEGSSIRRRCRLSRPCCLPPSRPVRETIDYPFPFHSGTDDQLNGLNACLIHVLHGARCKRERKERRKETEMQLHVCG
jgi:hypothetical protein